VILTDLDSSCIEQHTLVVGGIGGGIVESR
jgi:hypothetical protein